MHLFASGQNSVHALPAIWPPIPSSVRQPAEPEFAVLSGLHAFDKKLPPVVPMNSAYAGATLPSVRCARNVILITFFTRAPKVSSGTRKYRGSSPHSEPTPASILPLTATLVSRTPNRSPNPPQCGPSSGGTSLAVPI